MNKLFFLAIIVAIFAAVNASFYEGSGITLLIKEAKDKGATFQKAETDSDDTDADMDMDGDDMDIDTDADSDEKEEDDEEEDDGGKHHHGSAALATFATATVAMYLF